MVEYQADRSASLRYPDGDTEVLQLSKVKWQFSRKTAKNFCNPLSPPPAFIPVAHQRNATNPRSLLDQQNQVKVFADDLTFISSDKDQHRTGLSKLDKHAFDLDLELRADKCVSMSIIGQKQVKKYTVTLLSGETKAISSEGTKFLVKFIGDPWKSTKVLASLSLPLRLRPL